MQRMKQNTKNVRLQIIQLSLRRANLNYPSAVKNSWIILMPRLNKNAQQLQKKGVILKL